MKKLLITGFEPFDGESVNPSWEAVAQLPAQVGDFSLTKLCLPVVFGKAARIAGEKAEEMGADAILCIGQAGGREWVTPEFVGINLRHGPIPDNEGNQPEDEPILPGGDKAYFSTLPVREIAASLAAAGIPARVSYTAGAYVCNDLHYTLLARFEGTGTKVGFLHVPYSTEQDKTPAMTPEQILKAVTVAVETIK